MSKVAWAVAEIEIEDTYGPLNRYNLTYNGFLVIAESRRSYTYDGSIEDLQSIQSIRIQVLGAGLCDVSEDPESQSGFDSSVAIVESPSVSSHRYSYSTEEQSTRYVLDVRDLCICISNLPVFRVPPFDVCIHVVVESRSRRLPPFDPCLAGAARTSSSVRVRHGTAVSAACLLLRVRLVAFAETQNKNAP